MQTTKSKRQELIAQIKADLDMMKKICKEADNLLLELITFTDHL